MSQGIKHDKGKPDFTLLEDFPRALEAVVSVAMFGEKKYSRSNWTQVANGPSRYSAAMLRHWFAEKEEVVDPETTLLHVAHVAWNALARLELILRDREKEDESSKNS